MTDDPKYKPEESLIDTLATKLVSAEAPTQIHGYTPTVHDPQIVHIESDDGREFAKESVKHTITALRKALNELGELAPASQKGFFYQTMALIAKTIGDNAQAYAALSKEDQPKEKKAPTSNHLHLSVTSAQMNEIIAAQMKKAKEDK